MASARARRSGPSRFVGFLVLVLSLVLPSGVGRVRAQAPEPSPTVVGTPGARTLGDPFYPTLGNGGYDTVAIDLSVAWTRPDADHGEGRAVVRTVLDLVALQDLSQLSLDLAPGSTTVSSVTVDGARAVHELDMTNRKLVVALPRPVAQGSAIRLDIRSSAVPGPVPRTGEDATFALPGQDPDAVRVREGRGLIADGAGGALLAAQPNGAHTLFPVNDHPLDKASMRIRLTAPAGMVGIATGRLERLDVRRDGSQVTTWATDAPVASHVVSLGIGVRSLITGRPVGDGVEQRSAVPAAAIEPATMFLAEIPRILAWLEAETGVGYPFESFGVLVYDGAPTQAILEGQSLVLLPAWLLRPGVDRCAAMGILVHEAAHQWYGNLVSITRWDHKWLSEGHATELEWRWLADHGCLTPPPPADTDGPAASPRPGASTAPSLPEPPTASPIPADAAAAALDARMRRAYREAAVVRERSGPPSAPHDAAANYTDAIYDQGALALHALRLAVGDRTFGRIGRTFLRRYAGAAASTDDFIRVASRVSRRDLGPFLEAWLRGAEVPPMPDRPRWTTVAPDPVASAAPG